MQVQPNKLLRQQMVLKELGFYTGPLDGVWGTQSIEAMRKFENRVDLYRPARQTGGLPFAEDARLPAGMWMERGLLCYGNIAAVTAEEESILASLPAVQPRSTKRTAVVEKQDDSGKIVLDAKAKGNQQQKHHGQSHKQRPPEDEQE